ncbi:MAG TPA: uridine diphosphate-N-acetylglucosamine-binding protein YvcK [Rugosimonospora sp.]|nr:uridine diphosphate-N-acetylglucosamine-binding protein YvcK [Rugosimonospora sp.]
MRVVAFGGGHGLSASLQALRRLPGVEITAVLTVGDDGGSSGRLRAERGCLPPGDLRQALAALADDDPVAQETAALFQHRFAGSDPLAGHAVGNLVLCALLERYPDPVEALDHAAMLVRAGGRVLPMSPVPVGIEAVIRRPDGGEETVRGQHQVAVTVEQVERVRISPDDPPACAEAVAAVAEADWLIFGPGSWYTSVIPHLLVPDLAKAITASRAAKLVTLNLVAEKETARLSLPDHLHALTRYLPGLRVDVVLADSTAVGDPEPVRHAARSLGAKLLLAPLAASVPGPRHDPVALAAALSRLVRAG